MRHGVDQVTRLAKRQRSACPNRNGRNRQPDRYVIGETRLGIPAMIHDECCSGMLARNATNFPRSSASSSTWTPDLAQSMTEAIRTQMRAVGIHQGLAPVLDIARDPRWGRIEGDLRRRPPTSRRAWAWPMCAVYRVTIWRKASSPRANLRRLQRAGGRLNWAPAHIMRSELRESTCAPSKPSCARRASIDDERLPELDGVPASAETLTRNPAQPMGLRRHRRLRLHGDQPTVQLPPDGKGPGAGRCCRSKPKHGRRTPNTVCYDQPLIDAVEAGTLPVA